MLSLFKILNFLVVIQMITARNIVKEEPGRIVGGTAARIETRPFQISFQRSGYHFCGGSIVASNIIITAAHCVNPANLPYYSIRAGSTTRNIGGVSLPVKSVKVHPNYNGAVSNDFDIAILELNGNLPFSTKIKPIQLAPPELVVPDGSKLVVSGWGTMRAGAPTSPNGLRSVIVPSVSDAYCKTMYGEQKITPRMLCAGATNKDSCQGDSGGPLTFGDYLVGVVSFGQGCGQQYWPGVYAKVSELIDDNFEFIVPT